MRVPRALVAPLRLPSLRVFFNMVLRLLAAAAALGTASAQCSSYMEVNQVRSKAAVSNLLVSAPLDSARLCSA